MRNLLFLFVLAVIGCGLYGLYIAVKRGTVGTTLRIRLRSWWRSLLKRDDGPVLSAASVLDEETQWTPPEKLPLDPFVEQGVRRIRLGYPVNPKTNKRIGGTMVHSEGWTPVGIVSGATGSWKTSGILAQAALLHGLDDRFQPIRRADGSCGSPLLLAAPKTELIELCLKTRLRQGEVKIIDFGSGRHLPEGGTRDRHGRLLPDLRPYLAVWSPLSDCDTWAGAQATAEAMTSGTAGGVSSGDFWENTAARFLAAALWAVRQRGPGTALTDVYRAVNQPKNVGGHELSPLRALQLEIEEHLASPDPQTRIDASLASLAVIDSEAGAQVTLGSGITTATTALAAVLTEGVAHVAWDDPRAVDIDELLLQSSGTLVITGTFSEMRSARPITNALMASVRRRAEAHAKANGGHLERQLLVEIDELVSVLGDGQGFSEWLASARSQNVQLLWATQDLSRLDAMWGEDLRTGILDNTVTRLWLPGTADPDSLKLAELLCGEHLTWMETRTTGDSTTTGEQTSKGRNWSTSKAQQWRPRATAGRVAGLQPGEAIALMTGRSAQLILERWFDDPVLRSLVETGEPPRGGTSQTQGPAAESTPPPQSAVGGHPTNGFVM